jgi:hypothetical protein
MLKMVTGSIHDFRLEVILIISQQDNNLRSKKVLSDRVIRLIRIFSTVALTTRFLWGVGTGTPLFGSLIPFAFGTGTPFAPMYIVDRILLKFLSLKLERLKYLLFSNFANFSHLKSISFRLKGGCPSCYFCAESPEICGKLGMSNRRIFN